jgi:phospholipid/cholesterol/gamma-HCH transport system substrate-binding protein
MRESLFETLVGVAVILVAGFFLVFSLSQQSGAATGDSYVLTAKFGRADGVGPGTDVRVAGVKVGQVTSVDFDPKTVKAVVKMSLRKDIVLPFDSTAQIQSDSLLGGSYIYVLFGGDPDEMLPTDGTGVFDYTRGTVDIMSLLLEAVGNASGGSDQGAGNSMEEAPL